MGGDTGGGVVVYDERTDFVTGEGDVLSDFVGDVVLVGSGGVAVGDGVDSDGTEDTRR
jgi:hypothetical protein